MKNAVAAIVACLFVTTVALASEISLVAGKGPLGDLERPEGTVSFRDPGLFGLRYEKDFLMLLGLENNLIIARNMLSPSGEPGETAFYYMGNFVLNFPVDRIVPNFVLGIGVQHRFGSTSPNVGTSFLTNWGLGVKFRDLAGPVGLRVDYRRIGIHGVEHHTVTEQEVSGGLLVSF